ncbi:hypothetical protein KR038_011755 [Drosophila bunnanda]|nr:hypothetical protein KR038_011755 [Drosophila bunnanda]
MSSSSITTVRNGGNLSRYELLDWMNSKVGEHIARIEDLCTGVVYCRLMGDIFPDIINMKRVKMMPRMEYEYIHNLRLLQDAFNSLELEQPVPIDLIIQGRFKHNFEFIQFFKKFYDSQTQPPPEKKVSRRRKTIKSSRSSAKVKAYISSSLTEILEKTEDPMPERELDNFYYEDPMPVIPEEMEYTQEYQVNEGPLDTQFSEIDQDNQNWGGIQDPQGSSVELMEEIIYDRDLAYHKLLLIEQTLADMEDDERQLTIIQDIINVLRAPMEDSEQSEMGDAVDPDPQQ